MTLSGRHCQNKRPERQIPPCSLPRVACVVHHSDTSDEDNNMRRRDSDRKNLFDSRSIESPSRLRNGKLSHQCGPPTLAEWETELER